LFILRLFDFTPNFQLYLQIIRRIINLSAILLLLKHFNFILSLFLILFFILFNFFLFKVPGRFLFGLVKRREDKFLFVRVSLMDRGYQAAFCCVEKVKLIEHSPLLFARWFLQRCAKVLLLHLFVKEMNSAREMLDLIELIIIDRGKGAQRRESLAKVIAINKRSLRSFWLFKRIQTVQISWHILWLWLKIREANAW